MEQSCTLYVSVIRMPEEFTSGYVFDPVKPDFLYSHGEKKWYMKSIISDLGFPRLSVADADGYLLTKKPQILWRAQVWVHSFGWWSWSHSLVLGLFAITLQGAKINLHMWYYAAFPKVWHKSIPLHSWVITQIPPWGLWNDFLGVLCYSSAFSALSLWRRSNMFSGLTSASPSHLIWLNCSGKCYSGLWVCPYLPISVVSTEVLLPILSFLLRCPLCPSLLLSKAR